VSEDEQVVQADERSPLLYYAGLPKSHIPGTMAELRFPAPFAYAADKYLNVRIPYCASGYTRGGEAAAKDAPLRNNFYTRPARRSSAGGGYSTIDDLLKFVYALESGELLIPNFQAQASAPGATDQPWGVAV
jgi:Beta-lactamase